MVEIIWNICCYFKMYTIFQAIPKRLNTYLRKIKQNSEVSAVKPSTELQESFAIKIFPWSSLVARHRFNEITTRRQFLENRIIKKLRLVFAKSFSSKILFYCLM